MDNRRQSQFSTVSGMNEDGPRARTPTSKFYAMLKIILQSYCRTFQHKSKQFVQIRRGLKMTTQQPTTLLQDAMWPFWQVLEMYAFMLLVIPVPSMPFFDTPITLFRVCICSIC